MEAAEARTQRGIGEKVVRVVHVELDGTRKGTIDQNRFVVVLFISGIIIIINSFWGIRKLLFQLNILRQVMDILRVVATLSIKDDLK